MYEREAADVTLRYVGMYFSLFMYSFNSSLHSSTFILSLTLSNAAYIRGKPFDNSMTPLVNLILQVRHLNTIHSFSFSLFLFFFFNLSSFPFV